jgi:anti-sigma regulatory factor (Ser/Thr protein kinase)
MDGLTATAPRSTLVRPAPGRAALADLLRQPPPRPSDTYLDLGAFDTAVPCARGHARNVLADWGIRGDAADTIELVVSELVTNALQATIRLELAVPSSVRLHLADASPYVLVEVADDAPAPPAQQHPEDAAEHGRGLMIVAAVCAEWGSYPVPGAGKVVWARIPGRAS